LADLAKAENQIVSLEIAEVVVVVVETELRQRQNWIGGTGGQMKRTKHTRKIS
jgi:hypothetical protein